MITLPIILGIAAAMAGVGLAAVLAWLLYTSYLNRLERRLAYRKGLYRDLVTGLALRDRALLEPQLRELTTLRDFEALEAVLEEQARGATERPAWLLDAYDQLGLVDKYVTRLRTATKWRERAFAAELLGRVGNANAVPALLDTVAATRSEDADVREIALRALARIGDPRAVAPLVEALKHSEVWLVPRIADILTRHGALVVDPMIAFLEDSARHPARAWAASILGEVGAARAFPSLVHALSDLDDEVRAKSASALGRLGDGRAVGYLLDHLLSDPAPFVRARIAQALGQFDKPDVVERLVRALGDPAWWVRMRSVEALEQVGAQAEGPLLLALDDADPEIRIRAAVALERLGVPARMIEAIERGENTTLATDTLARFGHAGARELLAEGLAHPTPAVRAVFVEAIRRAGRRDLATELVHVARSDADPALRAGAFEVLRALQVTEGIAAALDHLDDGAREVRTAALLLVGQLGGPAIAERIESHITDGDPAVRAATATALGLTGARAASRSLLGLLADSDSTVQREAVLALGQLGDAATAVTLLDHFPSAAPLVRVAIATAVTRLDVAQVPALLASLMEADDRAGKLAVIHTVAEAHPPSASAVLGVLWRDPDAEVRAALVRLWWHHPDLADATLLERMARDPVAAVRVAVAAACAAGSAGQSLAVLATDSAEEVRAMAAVASLLAGSGDTLPADIPRRALAEAAASVLPLAELHRRASDASAERRQAAGIVLALLDDSAAHRLAADDPAPAVRHAVRAALPAA